MPRIQRRANLLLAVVFIASAAFSGQRLEAGRRHVYDFDSLVHLGTKVVEGEITRSYSAHSVHLIDLKVTFSHKGSFKIGESVAIAYTDGYRKPLRSSRNAQPLAVGDRLVVFVARAKPNEFNRIPADAVVYAPLQGGMRLIEGDHVFGFQQWDSPGPFVADVPFDPAKAKLLTVERFREQLRGSLRNTQELARLVDARQDKLDVPGMMKLLEDRSEQMRGGIDYFTQRVCMRFAETHDPELLSRALPLAKSYYDISILQHGFGTPKGRDYLLAKISDPKEPMPARVRYTHALANAGDVYRSTYTEISRNGHRIEGKVDEGNSQYLTRIATTARANVNHDELCRGLIRCLGQGTSQNEPEMLKDRRSAFAVLKELYVTKPTVEIQFAIEKALSHDQHAYENLESPCGAFISILRPVDPTRYTKPEQRSLIFEYEYNAAQLPKDVEVQPAVVLVHQGTGKRYVLPCDLQICGWASGGGSRSVVLPKDLPTGRYHVFLQLHDGKLATSIGHYFATDL